MPNKDQPTESETENNRPSYINTHYSVGPDGKTVVDLVFVEEPLGMPAADKYGWPQFEFGETIGPGNRYVLARKLGWGMSSSTWLARDQFENRYVAIKVLNGYHTGLVQDGLVWELEALKKLSTTPPSPHCLSLLANFTVNGKGSAGDHACFVTRLLGGDVKGLQDAHGKVFPLPLAKRILLHTLRGIAHAHKNGVVHTDIKHDNIFLNTVLNTGEIDQLIASDPSRQHPPEASLDGVVRAAVSQPLPLPTVEEALNNTFVLADFGSGEELLVFTNPPSPLPQLIPLPAMHDNEITPYQLRPPEIFIRGPWNEKVDIWTFGCLIFELTTKRELYRYEPGRTLDSVEHMLYQMMLFTGEDFEPEQLRVSKLAAQYFDDTCNLRKRPHLYQHPFEKSIRNYKVMTEEDVLSTAAVIRRCQRLDPKCRPSAEELLEDSWFTGVD